MSLVVEIDILFNPVDITLRDSVAIMARAKEVSLLVRVASTW